MRKSVIQNIAVVALLSSASLFANQAITGKVELTSNSAQEKMVINAEGIEELQILPIDKIVPGDVVVYSNNIVNNSDKSATDLVIVNPIPKHMEYIQSSLSCDTSTGCNKLFSIDGGASFKERNQLFVTDNKGGVRIAYANEITTVKWILNQLAVHSKTELKFKAKLK